MKKIIFVVLFTICSLASMAQIKYFQGSLSEALEAAKKENKQVMVIASATWCGPCKVLAKNVFATKEASDYIDPRLIVIKYELDIKDTDNISKTYDVQSYPTMIFIDIDGKEISRMTGGGGNTQEFLSRLEKLINPNNSSDVWEAKIAKKPSEIVNYLNYLYDTKMYDRCEVILNDALIKQPISMTFSEPWINYYRKAVSEITSPVIKIMIEKQDEVSAVMGKELYESFMLEKGVRFISRKVITLFFDINVLQKVIEFEKQVPALQSQYLNFIDHNIDKVIAGDLQTILKEAKKYIKKCDKFSRMWILNTALMVVQKNKLPKNDPRYTELLDLAIKYEKDAEKKKVYEDAKVRFSEDK